MALFVKTCYIKVTSVTPCAAFLFGVNLAWWLLLCPAFAATVKGWLYDGMSLHFAKHTIAELMDTTQQPFNGQDKAKGEISIGVNLIVYDGRAERMTLITSSCLATTVHNILSCISSPITLRHTDNERRGAISPVSSTCKPAQRWQLSEWNSSSFVLSPLVSPRFWFAPFWWHDQRCEAGNRRMMKAELRDWSFELRILCTARQDDATLILAAYLYLI